MARSQRCTVWLALGTAALLSTSSVAYAQNDDIMGFDAAAKTASHPDAAAQSAAAALVPPPGKYMSNAWSFWPHAWGYVPSLWSTWYRDVLPPLNPPVISHPDDVPGKPALPAVSASAPVLLPPKVLLTGDDSQGLPAPHLIRKRRLNLVISGAGLLVATWAADRLLAQDLSSSPWSWVPLIGPWYLLSEQSSLASPSRQAQVFLVADGVLQAGGLTMAILGFVLTTKRYMVTVKPASDLAPRPPP